MRLLVHRAYEKFPQLSSQPTIKLLHFVTYTNQAEIGQKQSFTPPARRRQTCRQNIQQHLDFR